jgi:hypothetical protein
MVARLILDSLSCEAHKPSRPKLSAYEVSLRGMDAVCLHAMGLPRATAEGRSPTALDRGVSLLYIYTVLDPRRPFIRSIVYHLPRPLAVTFSLKHHGS